MNLINIEKITKSFTDHKLFDKRVLFPAGGRKGGRHRHQRNRKDHAFKNDGRSGGADEGTITTANHAVIRLPPPASGICPGDVLPGLRAGGQCDGGEPVDY